MHECAYAVEQATWQFLDDRHTRLKRLCAPWYTRNVSTVYAFLLDEAASNGEQTQLRMLDGWMVLAVIQNYLLKAMENLGISVSGSMPKEPLL